MFTPIPGGSSIVIEGITCHIPPIGHGCHADTGDIQPTDIIKRSTKKEEQFWERVALPENFENRVKVEAKRQEMDKDYSDPSLDNFRIQEWRRRIYGCHFWNNGQLVYLTGLHYFYLNYWRLPQGFPDFRIIDLEKAYLWQYNVEDPKSYGMIEVRKRRDGKSFFAGCMLFECLSRTRKLEGGIISFNKEAAEEMFSKTVVSPFKTLPSFFIPVWDSNSTLKSDIRFNVAAKKGKNNILNTDDDELGSWLTYMDSKPRAYDGHQLKRCVVDEVAKTEVDCIGRHLTIKYCCTDHTGAIVGKILYTSTVEEIGVKRRFDKMWGENDQLRRLPIPDSIKRSGELCCFFMPAFRSGRYDKYGYGNDKAEKQRIEENREHLRDSESDLIADMRKNPFDVIQAFRITSNTCHFDQAKLHNRIDEIGWADLIERGDMVWENGVPLTKSLFIPNKQGKFWIPKGFKFDSETDCNNVVKRGNSYWPGNTSKYTCGLDGFDHNLTEDNRKSNAALYVLKRHNPMNPSGLYDRAFVLEYVTRPATAAIMYDDVMKVCFYFGCALLFENNKPGIGNYFKGNKCTAFLIHLDDYKEPGIPCTPQNKQTGVDIIEEHIHNHLDKVYYKRVIQSWIRFNVNDTQKEDESMGSMWTLFSDRYKIIKRDISSNLRPITDYVRKYKITA